MKSQRNGKRIGEISSCSINHSMGKVKEFNGAVNNRETQGNKRVSATRNYAIKY